MQLGSIYAKHIFSPHFESTFKAAVTLIILPAITNIYYAIRPQGLFSGIMPFAMPIVCLANYIYFINKDMKGYCFTQ